MAPPTLRMFLWLFFLGNVISTPVDEYFGVISEGELAMNGEKYIKNIVPSGYSVPKVVKYTNFELKDFVSEDNEYYQELQKHIQLGHTMHGITFNLYEDNIREPTIALFRLLKSAKEENLPKIRYWALKNINKDIVDYVYALLPLYRDILDKRNLPMVKPPFLNKPNHFVNSEAIHKALKLKISNGKFDEQEALVNQYYREDNVVTINANYSSWNFWNGECEYRLDYFREDISLNSYYYGIHLLYPFWMNNDELSELDSRYAELYYFTHKQLIARYNLEKEHLKSSNKTAREQCYTIFNPSLVYDNGLAFPMRLITILEWNENQSKMMSIDIAIKECISRGFIFMENGTKVTLTENNYIELLAKLIRANYEGIQISKVVKSYYGYGNSGYSVDRYNPAPSVLHNPDTTLRDPIHWYLIESLLKYFSEYSKTLEPYDFSKYTTDVFEIIDKSFTKVTTYFDHYKFSLDSIFGEDEFNNAQTLTFAARQRRLKHLPFVFNFTVNSSVNLTGNVKLFLGPKCDEKDCWNQYSSFYELDTFPRSFTEGLNYVTWTTDMSSKFSFDDYYNMESRTTKSNKFDLFKFPENLVLPRGLEGGLDLTLFIMIIPQSDNSYFNNYEALGFPFHRQASIPVGSYHGNYKFYDITIYHKGGRKESNGNFSPHLS